MTTDHRNTPGLIHDILDALERHGYRRSDNHHADRAIGLIGDLACIYEGTQDHPATAYPVAVPPSPPAYPGPSSHDAITLTRADASTVFAAPDIAADDKRYRVEMCPDCPDQSCPACQTHLRDAQAFDQMADRMLQAAEAARAATPAGPGQIASPSPPPTGRPASDAHPQDTARTRTPPPGRRPLVPDPRAGERDMPRDRRPLRPAVPRPLAAGRPEYVIVVDQLRDWQPGQPPSLAELLETRPARTREPEPDLEAEP